MSQLREVLVPFPERLMSSARAASKMPTTFAREIINMYMRQDGAGTKRNGFSPVGQALGETITRLMPYITKTGEIQILAATSEGNIYLQEGEEWTLKYKDLDPAGKVRWAHFAGKLVLCNGVNDMISWDGETFSVIQQDIVDLGAHLTYLTPTTLSIDSMETFYQPGTYIQARLGNETVESTVQSVSTNGDAVIVVLEDPVLTSALTEVSFRIKPPRFAYIYPAHDRLWGFGEGALKPDSFGSSSDRSRVYYTHGLNDEMGWYDDEGLLQYINIADKMPSLDQLMGMALKDGLTIFFCRNNTQVWAGSDPTMTGDFTWQKTLPLGVVHGDLIVELPNDVGFFTRYGARTLSRILQTEQLDVGDFGVEVNPTLAEAVQRMIQSPDAYKNVQAFRYDPQGWFGFKAFTDALVFQVRGSTTGWTLFTGMFSQSTASLNTPDGKLYIAYEGRIYQYDEDVWVDGEAPIYTRWWTPWMNVGSSFKRWANKRIQVISEQGAAVALTLKRFKNYDSSSFMQKSVTASVVADYWDDAAWDTALWDNGVSKPEIKPDHFVADVFSYAVESNSTAGPLTLFGIKIQGVSEQ